MRDGEEKYNRVDAFKKALETPNANRYVLRLFVSGSTPRSVRAVHNIKKICEEHLSGKYELEVIDVYQQPGRAMDEDIIATPTLVRKNPLPPRKFIGDFSDMGHILERLDIMPMGKSFHLKDSGQEKGINQSWNR